MGLREIVTEGDDVLTKKCREVTKFDDRLAEFIDDMIETLHNSGGVGLAAPQVGFLRRVVVIEVDPEQGVIELVNPEIIREEGKQVVLEGCLSLPGKWGITSRPYRVTVRAQDRNGDFYEITGDKMLAQAFCHEIDHLNGVLYNTVCERMLLPQEIELYNEGELDLSEECYVELPEGEEE
ncbi:MAG: peptide deformylase [Ruminococcus sp.]|nr:peptide deformylase [Ruminococcus sp.]